jgi:hypothetical protein
MNPYKGASLLALYGLPQERSHSSYFPHYSSSINSTGKLHGGTLWPRQHLQWLRCCIFTTLNYNCNRIKFVTSTPFSPSTTSNPTVSPSPTGCSDFLEIILIGSYVCSLVNPFLTLNHFTVSKTFIAMNVLFLLVFLGHERPYRPLP